MQKKLLSYYKLAKPGIVYGNAMHALACALFAWALAGPNWQALFGVLVGSSLVIASACVVNCITDRNIDAKMERTRKRPLPQKEVSLQGAIIYAIVLGVIGFIVLGIFTNWLAVTCMVICHVSYTVVYAWAKRHTWLSTIVGTIPGAMPAVAGYTAIDPSMPAAAWALGLVILVWQLPHFYALSLYRRDDYAKTGMPLISVVKSREFVVGNIFVTAIMYAVVAAVLFAVQPTIYWASGVMLAAALAWVVSIFVAKNRGSDSWARRVFGTSLYMPISILLAGIIAVAVG